jgi:hypothetical protein
MTFLLQCDDFELFMYDLLLGIPSSVARSFEEKIAQICL